MRFLPPETGNRELDYFLRELSQYVSDLPLGNRLTDTGAVVDPVSGVILNYTYQYLWVKYGTDNKGGGFSDDPTGCSWYGLCNSAASSESLDWFDYTWYPVDETDPTVTFDPAFLYYKNLGSRNIEFGLFEVDPGSPWSAIPPDAINLDSLIPDGSVGTAQLADGAVTEPKMANLAISNRTIIDGAVSTAKLGTQVVTNAKLADGAVSNAKVANLTLTIDKFADVTQMSVDQDSNGIKLVNDQTSPGNNRVYGTDQYGVKGWVSGAAGAVPYLIPSGETFVLPVNYQACYVEDIVVEGTLEINGHLYQL